MTNQNIQQSKTDHKGKAIVSLVLGVISITPFIILKLMIYLGGKGIIAISGELSVYGAGYVFYLIAPAVGLVGLILGILGLKSTKKNFAIAGIVLCVIALLVLLISSLIIYLLVT